MGSVEKQTVILRCQRDDETIEVKVPDAYVYKGLAIHKSINGKRGWTLTHVASSVILGSELPLKTSDIEGILVDLGATMNWEQDYDSIVNQWLHDESLKNSVKQRLSELHREQRNNL